MEQYAFDLSVGMKERGHELFFVIANDGDVVYPRFEKIGKVYLLPLKSKFDFKSIAALRKILKIEKPDIIHTHQPKNIFHAKRASRAMKGVAIVHTLHFAINPTSPDWLYRRIFAMPARTIGVSDLVCRRAMEVYPNLDPRKVVRVINSVNTSRIERSQMPSHDTPVVGYAGRLVADKGVDVLIRAAARLNDRGVDFRMLIAGRGDDHYTAQLQEMVRQSGLQDKVEFVGFVDRMSEFISQIDIAVLPSVVSEACSLMLLEYMYAGRAIVASDNGSQGEVIESGREGVLISPSNDKALSEALETLLLDGECRQRMGLAARNRFDDQFSFDKFIDTTLEVYRDALQDKKR